MTTDSITLEALTLILRLLNSPAPTIAGSLLFEEFPGVAYELVNRLFLTPTGCLGYLTHGHQGFADLTWCSETRRHRYFSSSAGWVSVPAEEIHRYTVDVDRLLLWLQGFFTIGAHYRVTPLLDDWLWHLGATRIRGYRVNLYFVRSLDTTERLLSVMKELRKESARAPAIVVSTSSKLPTGIDMPQDIALVSLDRLLSRTGGYCVLDELSVLSILQGYSEASENEGGIGLRFSTDFRRVRWNGQWYTLTKKQSAVMEALYREGGRAHKDLLRAEAETNEELHRIMRNKIDGKWVIHPLWNSLIKKEGGGYYFLDGY
ncbi:hypothetical protein HCH_05693 [Hahella chejuensis KCTC 2396]|uniref:Uncharacterized protein n=1 Tax=Hahella chejuensis (strain KCTC 2396) TaxID=349521 RepID=Q2SAH5_HAHCH|nr:hypothetical protein [Hahella chejuensis]ABC32349.1 hypothetical protein HCH_05693 [Hahella chejuensis KCTC 2396]